MRLRRALTLATSIALVASGAAIIGAMPASAAGPLSAEVVGGVLTVEGSARADHIYVNFIDPTHIQLSTSTENFVYVPMTPGPGCEVSPSLGKDWLQCRTAGVTKVVVRAGDGDDLVYTGVGFRSLAVGFWLPVEYYGGNGRDDLRGGPGDDKLYGEGGNDKQILGDAGADYISGGEGDDGGLRGEGSGVKPSEFRPDVIDGGPGIDTFTEGRVGLDRTQFWSLDGIANDGSDLDDNPANGAEEGDNILPNVENIIGTWEDDVIIGSSSNNVIRDDHGTNVVVAGAGNDEIYVDTFDAIIDAGPGDDIVRAWGNATVQGGPGNDVIVAGGIIDAGPGQDSVTGATTNDVIIVNDGDLDQVSCGAGADIVFADEADVLDTDLLCELEVGKVGTRKLLPGGINLSVVQPGTGQVTVSVIHSGRVLGTSRVRAVAAGSAPVSISLKAGDRKKFQKLKSLPVTVRTVFMPAGGGDRITVTRKVTLTR
jgi:Ca2+-binding RTX toxin-like protein